MALPSFTVLLVIVVWVVNYVRKIGSREQGLPPGPPTLPFIGNLHIYPTTQAHIKFTEWAGIYGDIYSVKIGPQTAVVISSPKLARECFELNSATTSDRPKIHVVDILYQGNELILSRYGLHWKNMRRAVHRLLNKEACRSHFPIQNAEASLMLSDILKDPQNLYKHIRRFSASVALSVTFGIHCPSSEDPILVELFKLNRLVDHLLKPGGHPPVDVLTFLKYIPERWAPWKTLCRDLRTRQRRYFFDSLQRCMDRVRDDRHNGSFMEYMLEHSAEYDFDREKTCYIGVSLIMAGADTTSSYLQFFILCMLENPEVLAKAQREIDNVIGHERQPELEDLENLPYVNAVINEVHRYRPAAPTSVPHSATADTSVGGYLIPKESIILMNIWGIGRDKELFEDPDSFWPERYIKSEFGIKPDADPTGCRDMPFAFGGGRRVCPGMHLASNSIALNVMNLFWAFSFDLLKDPNTGLPVPIDINDTTDDLLLTPKPFTCDIKPRSAAKAEIIKKQLEAVRPIFDLFEQTGKKENT